MQAHEILAHFGIRPHGDHIAHSPIDGAETGRVAYDDAASIESKIANSVKAFRAWRDVPAPKRGELVRLFGEELRANRLKQDRIPVKVEELLLAAGELTHVNNFHSVDTHSLERRTVSDRRDDELSAVFEANEPAIEEMINARR